MAAMTPSQFQYQKEHINDDRSSEVIAVASTMAVAVALSVTLRFVCRKHFKVGVSYDDWLMLVAMVLALGLCFVSGYGTHVGTGRHLLAVGAEGVVDYLKLEYAFQLVYSFTMISVRLSILAFYNRLFPRESTPRWWRMCLYTVGFFTLSYGTAGLFTVGFECRPISYFWTRTGEGKCINEELMLYFSAALTIFSDLITLALPMPIVWRLQMPRAKKLGVMGIFALGGFACIASIIRMVYIPLIIPVDPTWTQVDPAMWSLIEPCMGIISACLPVIGPLLRTKIGSFSSSGAGSSWLSRSKRSRGQGGSYAMQDSSGERRRNSAPLGNMQKKPVVTATVYSTNPSQSDEEMALPLRG